MQPFLNLVKKECKDLKVKLILSPDSHVACGGGVCNGYFVDSPTPTLAVGMGKEEALWLPVLVHEFCHLKQWQENSKAWTDNKIGKLESMDLIDLWLNNKIELTEEQKQDYFMRSILVEKDCEERVVELIKLYNLPIDPIDYTQRANSYLMFYHLVKKYRRWYTPHKEPYNLKHIYESMPKNFSLNYHKLETEMEEILFQCFI